MKHTWHNCFKEDCFVCNGGLAECDVCGGAEGSLTTECCLEKIPMKMLDRIYAKQLDFCGGQWVTPYVRKTDEATT